ncbi:hypothetical protein CEXT_27831 [Caerostris extrusa]|uniref:Uncharacterized protein n=1 Tax=Caerostris extrusa TaxID=172846 RepID=A0AAV4U9F2_CAEEX|nr:hypothetical protein CEXT_27831 [Caerostris extrusa]
MSDFGIQSPGTWRCGCQGNRLSVRVRQHPEHVTGMPTSLSLSSSHLFNSPRPRAVVFRDLSSGTPGPIFQPS